MATKAAEKNKGSRNKVASNNKSDKQNTNEFVPHNHYLVPKHEICDEQEIESLYERYELQPTSLPTILITDPAIRHLEPKIGDIIKITRHSPTAGVAYYYRRVTNE